jgi:hypothetical protein
MTHEAIIEKVKKNYAKADEATIYAVLQTLQDAKVELRWPDLHAASELAKLPAITFKPPLKFVGENPSPEAYRKLTFDERGALSEQLKEENHQWLEEKFDTLKAAWLMVMDGEIIASGDHLKTYPQREQISEILARYGKQPFIFINDFLLAIEESWHSTVYKNDFYPTPVKFCVVHCLLIALRNGTTVLSSASIPATPPSPDAIFSWSYNPALPWTSPTAAPRSPRHQRLESHLISASHGLCKEFIPCLPPFFSNRVF